MREGHSRYDRPREPVIVNLGDAHGAAAEGRKEAGGRPRDTGRTGERSRPGRTGENGEGEAKSKAGGGGRGRSCRAGRHRPHSGAFAFYEGLISV